MKTSLKALFTLFFVSFLFTANAQSQNTTENSFRPVRNDLNDDIKSLCLVSEKLIEESLKSIAYENVAGIGDNSAPREATRQLRIVAAKNLITSQLIHMQALHCPPLLWNISHNVFVPSALECAVAMAQDKDYKEKCNRNNLTRASSKSK